MKTKTKITTIPVEKNFLKIICDLKKLSDNMYEK